LPQQHDQSVKDLMLGPDRAVSIYEEYLKKRELNESEVQEKRYFLIIEK
jgi:hypothetical protein